MGMYLSEAFEQMRGLNLLAIKQINSVSKSGHDLHMIDDYETLVSQKEREVLSMTEVISGLI